MRKHMSQMSLVFRRASMSDDLAARSSDPGNALPNHHGQQSVELRYMQQTLQLIVCS